MDHAGHHSLYRVHGAAVNGDEKAPRSHCPTCGGTLAGNDAHSEAICIKTLQEQKKTLETTLRVVRKQRDDLHGSSAELAALTWGMDLSR